VRPIADTPPTSVSPSSYTIHPGDSLSAIAKQVYGDANAWRAIYDANRGAIGDNPDVIHPGTDLVVPAKD
jgi:nucleoid-associated protein YgaU